MFCIEKEKKRKIIWQYYVKCINFRELQNNKSWMNLKNLCMVKHFVAIVIGQENCVTVSAGENLFHNTTCVLLNTK